MSIYVDVEKRLGPFRLKVRFSAGNEVLALLGASGCGKSMTLKCIAGIEKPDKGIISVDGRVLFDSVRKINLSPQERHTGLLFQNYALFPNMTVLQNIRAGARREQDPAQREKLTSEIIESFGLSGLLELYPAQLSGGQQQRVALARILVSSPDILLMDEPFSALDSHLRFRLEGEVRQVLRDFGKTVILVSHDRDEVFRLSEKIVMLKDGTVDTFGSKDEVFANPETRNAALLTGCKNISRAVPIDDTHVRAVDWGVDLKTGSGAAKARYVGIQTHDIRAGEGDNSIFCRVTEVIENPFSYTVMLTPVGAANSIPIGWKMDKAAWAKMRSECVRLDLPPESILLLKS